MIGKFIASILFVATVQPVAANTVEIDDAVGHAMHFEDLEKASLAQRKELANSLLAYPFLDLGEDYQRTNSVVT